MSKPNLKIIRNEFKPTRVLPDQKPKALNPPRFEVELVDMHNPGVKWYYGIIKYF